MELKREEIIKALECCEQEVKDCPYCPLTRDYSPCSTTMAKNALSLINELTEENERLKHTISLLGKNNDELARVLPLAKKEVEVETRADTVSEMQERLKNTFDHRGLVGVDIIEKRIDQIAKEMLEETENDQR